MREIFRYGGDPARGVDKRIGHQRGGGTSERRLTTEEFNANRGVYRAPDSSNLVASKPENRLGGGFAKGRTNPLDAVFNDPPKKEVN